MEESEHKNSPRQDAAHLGSVQGEGDYRAAADYRNDVNRFLEHADVEKAAREAAPRNPKEARELEQAEAEGRSHAREGSIGANMRKPKVSLAAVQDAIRGRPVTAMAMAGAVGYLIGRIRERRYP